MVNERWNRPEQKERMSGSNAGKSFLEAALTGISILGYIEKHGEEAVNRELEEGFEKLKRHPTLFKEIGIQGMWNLVGGYQDEELRKTKEREQIHQSTAKVIENFQQRTQAQKEAGQREQEAARAAAEVVDKAGEMLVSQLANAAKWFGF